ncbi:MAG TPA: polysaccharide pyruvyl transferase family protein [Limnochordia bacterium]|nr:polysaccharide pyruvyl transferase family protein [Limnochordia bacterium]
MRLLAVGYYGAGNPGDEALLAAWSEQTRALRPGVQVTAVSHDPAATETAHALEATPWRDLGALRSAVRRCDAVVAPGGSLFQDATSARSLGAYAALCEAALRRGRPLALVAQGVGPLGRRWAATWTASIWRRAAYVSVRDAAAANWCRGHGIVAERTADLSFALSPAAALGNSEVVLVVRRAPGWAGAAPAVRAAVEELGERLSMPVRTVAFQVRDEVALAGRGESWAHLGWAEVRARLAGAALVVSARLHGLLFALGAGRPGVAWCVDEKLRWAAAEWQVPALTWGGAPAAQALAHAGALAADPGDWRREALARAAQARRRAAASCGLALAACGL